VTAGPERVTRIAHFSDVHVLSLKGARASDFFGKRATGAVNLALNRARHYRVEVFQALLESLDAAAPDHTVCTGDLVNLALDAEFLRVEALLARRFADDALTLVPGNHDFYARDAAESRRFERSFGRWIPSFEAASTYPVLRRFRGISLVGLSTATPSAPFLATGTVGRAQCSSAARALAQAKAEGDFKLVALHHPVRPDASRPLDHLRRLTDAAEVVDVLRQGGADLVVHGHNHVYLRQTLPGVETPVVQVASGSRFAVGHMAEFNVYVITNGALSAIERFVYSPERHAFVRGPVERLGADAGRGGQA